MKSLKYIFFCFILLCIGYSCNDSSSHDHEPPKVMFTLAGEINNSEDTVVSIVSMIGNKIVFDTVYMDSCYFN